MVFGNAPTMIRKLNLIAAYLILSVQTLCGQDEIPEHIIPGIEFILREQFNTYSVRVLENGCEKNAILKSEHPIEFDNSCIVSMKAQEIFFNEIPSYFELESFKVKRNKTFVRIEHVTPNYEPVGENRLLFELVFKLEDEQLEVIRFDKVLVEYKVKLSKSKSRITLHP